MASENTQFKKGHTAYNKGCGVVNMNCKNCAKSFVTRVKKRMFCSVSCKSKFFWSDKDYAKKLSLAHEGIMIGEKSPRWVKDRSTTTYNRPLNSFEYSNWRKEVFTRDNFTCKMSKGECSKRIEAHHILSWKQYPELRYDINNGITLCRAHHPLKRAEEERLSPFFQELIRVQK